uniref:Uncharacterized protein n=1 Tax=Janibacter limosus TaxID=53458 RepID=A0AC61U6U4_9MICO
MSAPYEAPADAELDLDTSALSIDEAGDRVVALLRERGHLNDPQQPEWMI